MKLWKWTKLDVTTICLHYLRSKKNLFCNTVDTDCNEKSHFVPGTFIFQVFQSAQNLCATFRSISYVRRIDSIQPLLASKEVGDSLDSVELLIKKHEDFKKSLAAQEDKIKVCVFFFTIFWNVVDFFDLWCH